MYGLILAIHVVICLVLIVIVLVQSGKSGGLGIFGGGSSDALFSAPSGNLFLKKLTVGFAVAFMCTTLLLTLLSSHRTSRSVIERLGGIPQAGAPQ